MDVITIMALVMVGTVCGLLCFAVWGSSGEAIREAAREEAEKPISVNFAR
mgnify:CR=1 FL=1